MLTVTWDAAFTACASRQFADKLSAASPYPSMEACVSAARRIWWQEVGAEGWLEAFAAHPEIGDAGDYPLTRTQPTEPLEISVCMSDKKGSIRSRRHLQVCCRAVEWPQTSADSMCFRAT